MFASSVNWFLGSNSRSWIAIHGIRDPELAQRIGVATALEVRSTGIQYVFAPCLAV
jgi:beta-glucosidase-like glycosyl hydrolase